jgi:hypothetical protein
MRGRIRGRWIKDNVGRRPIRSGSGRISIGWFVRLKG